MMAGRPSRRTVGRLGRSVLAVTALLVAGTVAVASLPPRPLRSVLTAIHAVSFRVATYWLVVVALVAVAERLAGSDRVTRQGVVRLAAVVFVGALAIEISPLARLVVSPPPVETARLLGRAVDAVQAALYPAGLLLGTGLAALQSRDAVASGLGTSSLPLAPDDGFGNGTTPAALWHVGRVLGAVAVLSGLLGVVETLAVAPDSHLVVAVAGVGVDALRALVDHLVVGVALFALLVYGVTARSLVVASAAALTASFLLGLVIAVVGALLGVVVVSTTVTPIPAVESADLADWPNPLALDRLVLVGTVAAAGVGVRTIHGRLAPGRPSTASAATNDSSDA
jgi:hypothetical protein